MREEESGVGEENASKKGRREYGKEKEKEYGKKKQVRQELDGRRKWAEGERIKRDREGKGIG